MCTKSVLDFVSKLSAINVQSFIKTARTADDCIIIITILMCDVILLFKAYHNMKSDSVEREQCSNKATLVYLTVLNVS